SESVGSFHADDLELVKFIAMTIALDIENVRLHRVAVTDPLTGAYNREFLHQRLPQEIEAAIDRDRPLSVAIVDVDHFKKYNDTHGHARGDDCLRSVARALTSVARRPADLAARYGGEEFGLLFPETDAPAMRLLIRAVLAAVRETDVTVSIGAVTVTPSSDIDATFALETADELLYEAKENGRDQARHLDVSSKERERLS
ncbi:MAG TPA: GGDEF domain-containing protein, partial [Thermoanaerobaculia bacterium]|nr:GGDEF domain-containing protein [Thermoanaerobaculia bacterium]